jgi:ADP-ribose pyrophosphatase
MYLARGLVQGAYQRDEDEALVVFEASFADCLGMIDRGEITDGKTIAALYLAEKYLARHP